MTFTAAGALFGWATVETVGDVAKTTTAVGRRRFNCLSDCRWRQDARTHRPRPPCPPLPSHDVAVVVATTGESTPPRYNNSRLPKSNSTRYEVRQWPVLKSDRSRNSWCRRNPLKPQIEQMSFDEARTRSECCGTILGLSGQPDVL